MPTFDCSHSLSSDCQIYPDDPPVEIEPHATVAADGYRVSAVSLGSHSGTHVDAPAHTEPDGATLDAFPVETFQFEAIRVDLDVSAREPIELETIRAAFACDSAATDADLLVLHTGWDVHWGTERYLDHPYLDAEAAAWLADRGFHVGVDALSVDPTPSSNASPNDPEGVPAHHALLGSGRLIVENLTGLDAPPARFTLHAYPLALAAADGAPVRAVAES